MLNSYLQIVLASSTRARIWGPAMTSSLLLLLTLSFFEITAPAAIASLGVLSSLALSCSPEKLDVSYWEIDRRKQESPSLQRVSERHVPLSIPCWVKLTCDVASLPRHWLVRSICPSALYRFNRCQGSFTALICCDSVMEEHRPLGAPKAQMRAK